MMVIVTTLLLIIPIMISLRNDYADIVDGYEDFENRDDDMIHGDSNGNGDGDPAVDTADASDYGSGVDIDDAEASKDEKKG